MIGTSLARCCHSPHISVVHVDGGRGQAQDWGIVGWLQGSVDSTSSKCTLSVAQVWLAALVATPIDVGDGVCYLLNLHAKASRRTAGGSFPSSRFKVVPSTVSTEKAMAVAFVL
jgi:hypothetical protein